jgi:hypothetical protein
MGRNEAAIWQRWFVRLTYRLISPGSATWESPKRTTGRFRLKFGMIDWKRFVAIRRGRDHNKPEAGCA